MAPPQPKEVRDQTIQDKVDEALGDAPEIMKTALENILVDLEKSPPDTVSQNSSAGRVGQRSGVVSELTVIMPLKPGGAERMRSILKLLNGNFRGADKIGTLHNMRFIFIENDTKMLFATTYDGDWDPYIEDFATKIPNEMDLVFGSVEGWAGIRNVQASKDLIAAHQLPADGWYVATPNLSVAETRRLERMGKSLDEFLDKVAEPA
jgi:hypothetical protein